jgi:hypothetical protein
MTHTAPRTPAEHRYDLAESGLADLARVGFDMPAAPQGYSSRSRTRRSPSPRDSPRTRMESGPSVRRLRGNRNARRWIRQGVSLRVTSSG